VLAEGLKERKDEASSSKARTHGSGWRVRSLYAIGLALRQGLWYGECNLLAPRWRTVYMPANRGSYKG
jgi:hypothetical protein